MKILLNFSGIILLFVGFALVLKPNFFSTSTVAADGYKMIERRVVWGFLLGIGLFLLFFNAWYSWKMTVLGLLIAFTAGIMIARVTGLALDGFFKKQVYWLLIELAGLIIFVFLYFLSREDPV